MLQQLNGLWSGCAFLWGLQRGELCPGADVSFYILGYLIWSLRQKDRRERGGQVVTPQCCTTPSSPTSGVEQSRAEALHRDVCRMLWAPFRPSQTDASNPGCAEVALLSRRLCAAAAGRPKCCAGTPGIRLSVGQSENVQANFLGNPQMKTCPFSTEQLRNFGCPPRVPSFHREVETEISFKGFVCLVEVPV